MRNRRWHYDKGKRTAEMICGKVQRLKDTADDEENGVSSHRTPAPRRVAADLESPQMSKRRMVDMAWWFSDPDNFGDGTDGAGVRIACTCNIHAAPTPFFHMYPCDDDDEAKLALFALVLVLFLLNVIHRSCCCC